MPEATITPNEAKMLHAIANTDYGDVTWVFAAIEKSGFDAQVAGGLLTSLQTKGLAAVFAPTRRRRGEDVDADPTVELTAAGRKALAALEVDPVPARGLLVHVLRAGNGRNDATNGGVSSRFTHFVLVGEGVPEVTEVSARTPGLRLERRQIGGRQADRVVPLDDLRGKSPSGYAGPMFGGNFVYSSDSRMPTGAPLPVHDRFETWADYRHMSL